MLLPLLCGSSHPWSGSTKTTTSAALEKALALWQFSSEREARSERHKIWICWCLVLCPKHQDFLSLGGISQLISEFESTAEMFLPTGRLQSFGTSALSVSWTATTREHPPYQGLGTLCLDSFPGPTVGETHILYPVALLVPPSIALKGWGRFYPGFPCVVEFCP